MEGLNLKNLSVLVVEDNDFMRQIIGKILREFKITDITNAYNGRKARELVHSNNFDICFID
jgi:CheY-like chemotaxis protein